MAKIKYYYDTETCKYERVKTRTSDVILNALGILSLTVVIAIVFIVLWTNYFPSPKELVQENEIKEAQYYLEYFKKEVAALEENVARVENRDDNIYRKVLGAEPIDKSVRDAGVGGADRYADIKEKNMIHSDMIVSLHEQIDKLKRKLYIESKSQDEVVHLAEMKEKQNAAIPAIQPISNEKLLALIRASFHFKRDLKI